MDDDVTRSDDLAAAWPEDDDLSLAGAAEPEETLQEVYNEPETDQPTELADDTTEGQAAEAGGSEHREDAAGEGLPEEAGARPEAAESAEPNAGSPVSWSATAREQWNMIPKPAQEYILQREQQMQQGMQKNAELARRAQGMDESLAPYQQYFAMNGGAGQTLQTLLQTGAILQMGSPAAEGSNGCPDDSTSLAWMCSPWITC